LKILDIRPHPTAQEAAAIEAALAKLNTRGNASSPSAPRSRWSAAARAEALDDGLAR